MFVCCMFLELGFGIVWNLNCHGTLLEPSFLEFWFKCLAFFVPLCSSACHVGVRCACCDTPGASLCPAMDGLAIPEVYSQAGTQETRLAELECRMTTGSLDTTTYSNKKTVRSGVQTEWNQMCFYMRPHSRVLHKEECQYLQGPGVKELHLCQICFQR